MDLWLIKTKEWTHIRARSVHGILWLQTHFEDDQWDALAEERVKLTTGDADLLSQDAEAAGLTVNSVPAFVNSKKL